MVFPDGRGQWAVWVIGIVVGVGVAVGFDEKLAAGIVSGEKGEWGVVGRGGGRGRIEDDVIVDFVGGDGGCE